MERKVTGYGQHQQDMKDLASSEQEGDLDSKFESDDEWKGLTSKELGKKRPYLVKLIMIQTTQIGFHILYTTWWQIFVQKILAHLKTRGNLIKTI